MAKPQMYLLDIYFENARENNTGKISFRNGIHTISKWNLLSANRSGREILRLIAASCGGTTLFQHLPFELQRLCRNPNTPLQVELVLALLPPYETSPHGTALRGSGIRMDGMGTIGRLNRKEYHFIPSSIPIYRAKTGIGDSWLFFLGYGPGLKYHDGTDDFDFHDPFFRATRFSSLFFRQAPLTDPVEFLTRLHDRAIKFKRRAPMHVLERLSRLIAEHFSVNTSAWMKKDCDFRLQLRTLAPWQRSAMFPVLDAARHILAAFPKSMHPLDLSGLILFDQPGRFYPGEILPRWALLMDRLFPAMQFVLTVGSQSLPSFPGDLFAASCQVPVLPEKPNKPPAFATKGAILLVDVDSRLPNLALMKLSTHFKQRGRDVVLARHEAFTKGVETVYASCVFTRALSQTRLLKLRKHYGDSLIIGGSGVDLRKRLPGEIEDLPADYTLYPELGDRAIGFITRGCPFCCPFCIVPLKEGKTRQVSTLDELLAGRRKLILLDDNILAHPSADNFLKEMTDYNVEVNFNQTLDLRLVDRYRAGLLRRIRCSNLRFTRNAYHFSLNDNRNLDEVRRKYDLFGFTGKNNVEFVCLYGFDTTLAEDVERFRFLRSLPGAYVFVQEYLPFPGGPAPSLKDFFDDRADELIDELISIAFPQNMKSMEKYYRWMSKRYAQAFGKLHRRLVDTIFRYNHRQSKGLYMATMANLQGWAMS